MPYVWNSATLSGLVTPTVIEPLPWLLKRLNEVAAGRLAAMVSGPPLVKLENVAGPITFTGVLPKLVLPARFVPPVTANVPGPARNPPLTAAPLSVTVAPADAESVPNVRLYVRLLV